MFFNSSARASFAEWTNKPIQAITDAGNNASDFTKKLTKDAGSAIGDLADLNIGNISSSTKDILRSAEIKSDRAVSFIGKSLLSAIDFAMDLTKEYTAGLPGKISQMIQSSQASLIVLSDILSDISQKLSDMGKNGPNKGKDLVLSLPDLVYEKQSQLSSFTGRIIRSAPGQVKIVLDQASNSLKKLPNLSAFLADSLFSFGQKNISRGSIWIQ